MHKILYFGNDSNFRDRMILKINSKELSKYNVKLYHENQDGYQDIVKNILQGDISLIIFELSEAIENNLRFIYMLAKTLASKKINVIGLWTNYNQMRSFDNHKWNNLDTSFYYKKTENIEVDDNIISILKYLGVSSEDDRYYTNTMEFKTTLKTPCRVYCYGASSLQLTTKTPFYIGENLDLVLPELKNFPFHSFKIKKQELKTSDYYRVYANYTVIDKNGDDFEVDYLNKDPIEYISDKIGNSVTSDYIDEDVIRKITETVDDLREATLDKVSFLSKILNNKFKLVKESDASSIIYDPTLESFLRNDTDYLSSYKDFHFCTDEAQLYEVLETVPVDNILFNFSKDLDLDYRKLFEYCESHTHSFIPILVFNAPSKLPAPYPKIYKSKSFIDIKLAGELARKSKKDVPEQKHYDVDKTTYFPLLDSPISSSYFYTEIKILSISENDIELESETSISLKTNLKIKIEDFTININLVKQTKDSGGTKRYIGIIHSLKEEYKMKLRSFTTRRI